MDKNIELTKGIILDVEELKKEMDEISVVELLIGLRSDNKYSIIHQNLRTLFQETKPIQTLCNILSWRKSNCHIRRCAIIALGDIQDESAVPILVKALRKDRSLNVRRAAAEALRNYARYESAVYPLIDTLKDKAFRDKDIQMSMIRGIIRGGHGKYSPVGPLVRSAAAPVLMKILEDRTQKLEVRILTANALGLIGNKSADSSLSRCLKDSSSELQIHAAAALLKLGDKRGLQIFLNALKSENNKVREWAYLEINIGLVRESRIVRPTVSRLINILQDLKSSFRVSAVRALGEIGSGSAVTALIAALKDQNPTVVEYAASSLAKIEKRKQNKLRYTNQRLTC